MQAAKAQTSRYKWAVSPEPLRLKHTETLCKNDSILYMYAKFDNIREIVFKKKRTCCVQAFGKLLTLHGLQNYHCRWYPNGYRA